MATSVPSPHPTSVTNVITDAAENVYNFQGVDTITFVLITAILFFAICCFSAIGYIWYTKIFLKERMFEENELAVMGSSDADNTVVSPMRAQRATLGNKVKKVQKPRASGFGFGDVFQGGDSIPMRL